MGPNPTRGINHFGGIMVSGDYKTILILAINHVQGELYKRNLGFKNATIITPDIRAPGIHADEIWIVGELVRYYDLIMEAKIIANPTAKLFRQPELPNLSGG